MKMPIRFQRKLLVRRNYKPSRVGHGARISFRPTRKFVAPIFVSAENQAANPKS